MRHSVLPEESVESEEDDDLSQVMRHRATIPWRSWCNYLSSAGVIFLPFLLLSQLCKHSLMVSIDYWLAHWTSHVIAAKMDAAGRNCTTAQVRVAHVRGMHVQYVYGSWWTMKVYFRTTVCTLNLFLW